MAERISAPGAFIKNNILVNAIHDEFSSFRLQAFKRRPSTRHPTPCMLTDLAEPTTPSAGMPTPSPDPHAEGALVVRAQHGDVAAFEALYRAHAPRVYALALRLTANRGDAGELTQDVFVHAWRSLTTFRGEAAFASWLHRIAVNAAFMRSRAEQRRTARIQIVGETDEHDDSGTSLREEQGSVPAVDVEQAVDLERAIAALPPGARRVFVLHDVVGYRHDEIARLTGLAEGTLRAQLHRARRLLMEALER
jgi:RNA polymerase sigma-70 factor (ECF subfamily)